MKEISNLKNSYSNHNINSIIFRIIKTTKKLHQYQKNPLLKKHNPYPNSQIIYGTISYHSTPSKTKTKPLLHPIIRLLLKRISLLLPLTKPSPLFLLSHRASNPSPLTTPRCHVQNPQLRHRRINRYSRLKQINFRSKRNKTLKYSEFSSPAIIILQA